MWMAESYHNHAAWAPLETVRPAAGAVIHARDLDGRAAHAVRYDVRVFGITSGLVPGDAAESSELGIFRMQVLDAIKNVQGDALRGGRVILGGEVADLDGGPARSA